MDILEVAEQLREVAEKKAQETGRTPQEAWIEVSKELDNIFENEEKKYKE